MNKMYLILGDWSSDGHGKCEKVLLICNKTVEEIQNAYKNSCKLTGISFNHNEDYTGVAREFFDRRNYMICTEYEDSSINETCAEILNKYGIKIEAEFINREAFVNLWIQFVQLSLPDLKVEQNDDNIPNINGYWDKNLNVQFGYGLFE